MAGTGVPQVRRRADRRQPHAVRRLRDRRPHRHARRHQSCPILYFVGSRDEMGRPAAVRGIRRAAPKVDVMYEVPLKAGHFGLVVGSTALTVTWPSVVEWMRWREGEGRRRHGSTPRSTSARTTSRRSADDDDDTEIDEDDDDEIASASAVRSRAGQGRRRQDRARGRSSASASCTEDLGNYLDNARWQLPRLQPAAQSAGRLADLVRPLARRAGRRDRRPHVLPVPRPRVHVRRREPPRRRGRARPDRVRRSSPARRSA